MKTEPSMYDWYLLMKEAEEVREKTGWGLASTWGLINRRDYEGAKAHLQFAKDHHDLS